MNKTLQDMAEQHIANQHKIKRPKITGSCLMGLSKEDYPDAPVQINWLCRKGEGIMISSLPGIGKTWMAYLIAIIAAHGQKVEGIDWVADIPQRVVFIDGEMPMGSIITRMDMLAAAMGIDDSYKKNINIFSKLEYLKSNPQFDFWKVNNGDDWEEILEAVKDSDMVIFDNLTTLTSTEDENASAMAKDVNTLLQIIRSNEITPIIVHHTVKESGSDRASQEKFYTPRGSGAFSAVISTDLRIALSKWDGEESIESLEKYIVRNTVLVYKDRNNDFKKKNKFHFHMKPDSIFQGVDKDGAFHKVMDEQDSWTYNKLDKHHQAFHEDKVWDQGEKTKAWAMYCGGYNGKKGYNQSEAKNLDNVIKHLRKEKYKEFYSE